MFCETCPLRISCKKICPEVKRQLPSMGQGRLTRAYGGAASEFLRRLLQRRAEVRAMLDHRQGLRGRLKQVIELKYVAGLSQAQIGQRLCITRRVAGRYLERAHRMLGKLMCGMKPRQRERRAT